MCLRQRFLVARHWIYSQMEDPRPRKKMLAGRQRIYGPDTVFSLPETEDVEDSKPRPMMLAAGQISGSPDRGSWLPERGFVGQTEDSGCQTENLWPRQRILGAIQRPRGKKFANRWLIEVPSRSLRSP